MRQRQRVILVVALAAVAFGGVGASLAIASADYRSRADAPSEATTVTENRPPELSPGHIVFRNTAEGHGYGYVAQVPVSAPHGPRQLTEIACDRVAAASGTATCLHTDRGVITAFTGTQYDAQWQPHASWPLAGIPSRTRVSPDGSLLATTAFVTGHAYAFTGFSTQTTIRATSGTDYGNLEDFTLTVNGSELVAADRNIWGVTFAGDNTTFYATIASSGRTWLARGDLSERTLTAIADDVECPSLSPDGTRIAFKKRTSTGPVISWTVAVLTLSDGSVKVLPESRNVDDQPEWLNNETVLYGLPRGTGVGDSDVWSIAADGSTSPSLLIEHAWSPTVLHE